MEPTLSMGPRGEKINLGDTDQNLHRTRYCDVAAGFDGFLRLIRSFYRAVNRFKSLTRD